MKLPKVTAIIPCLPDTTPKGALETLTKVDYPKDKVEIIITKGRNPSKQRNLAIEQATGEIIFFFDDDTEIPQDYIKSALKHYEGDIDGLGGPAETSKTDGFLQKCFGYVIGSYFATQNMSNKFKGHGITRKATEKELILCNFSIRRGSLGKHRFNENLYPNEENELFNRLIAEGKKFIYDPELKIYRKQRKSLLLFSKQFYKYGYSRMEHLLIRPASSLPVFFIPPIFIIYLLSLTLAIAFQKWNIYLLIPIILYSAIALASSIKIAVSEKDLKSLFVTPFLFLVVHASYGSGMLINLLKFKKEKTFENDFEVTKTNLK